MRDIPGTGFRFDDSLGFWAYRLHFQGVALLRRSFQEAGYDVTPEQWGLLARLRQNEGIAQSRLGEMAYKDRHNITRILNQLQKRGYINRLPDSGDKRIYRLYLTGSGRQVHDVLLRVVMGHFERVYQDIGREDIDQARAILKRITGNLEKMLHEG